MGVQDETVEIDFLKRNFSGNVETHHNHPGNPGKEDVGAGFHNVQGIERRAVFWGPVGTDDGPVGRGEPGVEGVFVSDVFYATDFYFC